MTALAGCLLGLAAILAFWSYLVYPALIRRLASGRAAFAELPEGGTPSVEVVVSASEEEAVIGERVANLLAQSFGGPYQVTVGCDGCEDATAERARRAGAGRVGVVEFPSRRGKAAVLNDLVGRSAADVIVFTDANTRFAPDALSRLVFPFSDPRVGSVCGRLVLEPGGGGGAAAETLFWARETRLKEAEGRLGVCLGGNGAIYAARRERVTPLPEDTSLDDFLIPARIAHDGLRVVFAGEAIAMETAPEDMATERARRFRIGIGAGQVLRRAGWLLDGRRHPALTLAFLSRKAARWLAPVLVFLGLLAGVASAAWRPGAVTALVLIALLLLLPPRVPIRGLAGKLYYFCLMNCFLAAGVVAGLLGMTRPAWGRTPRNQAS